MADAPAPPEPSAGHAGGGKASGILSRKVGPFSIGVWALLIGSGLVAGTYLRSRRQATPAPATDAPTPEPTGTVPQRDGAAGVLPATTGPTTNLEWSRKAISALIAMGQDPATVQSALAKWLNSTPLTAQERAIVSLALSVCGPPPEGAPSITDAPTPDPSTPNVPAPPGQTSTPTPAPTAPHDAYPGVSNLVVIETANHMLYTAHSDADFAALRDTLAVRSRDGSLCGNDPAWHESQDPNAPRLLIADHVGARMAQLGWHGKC